MQKFERWLDRGYHGGPEAQEARRKLVFINHILLNCIHLCVLNAIGYVSQRSLLQKAEK